MGKRRKISNTKKANEKKKGMGDKITRAECSKIPIFSGIN